MPARASSCPSAAADDAASCCSTDTSSTNLLEAPTRLCLMSPQRQEWRVVAVAGTEALVAVGLNLAFSAVAAHCQRKRRELPGFSAQVNLSAAEIKRLADRIIAKSKETYDAVAAVPLDKVSFANAIAPLAELDAQQFPLVQACVLPRMLSPSDDVRRASDEAEKRLDSHFLLCR